MSSPPSPPSSPTFSVVSFSAASIASSSLEDLRLDIRPGSKQEAKDDAAPEEREAPLQRPLLETLRKIYEGTISIKEVGEAIEHIASAGVWETLVDAMGLPPGVNPKFLLAGVGAEGARVLAGVLYRLLVCKYKKEKLTSKKISDIMKEAAVGSSTPGAIANFLLLNVGWEHLIRCFGSIATLIFKQSQEQALKALTEPDDSNRLQQAATGIGLSLTVLSIYGTANYYHKKKDNMVAYSKSWLFTAIAVQIAFASVSWLANWSPEKDRDIRSTLAQVATAAFLFPLLKALGNTALAGYECGRRGYQYCSGSGAAFFPANAVQEPQAYARLDEPKEEKNVIGPQRENEAPSALNLQPLLQLD